MKRLLTFYKEIKSELSFQIWSDMFPNMVLSIMTYFTYFFPNMALSLYDTFILVISCIFPNME